MKLDVYRSLIEEFRAPLSSLVSNISLSVDNITNTITAYVDDVSDYEVYAYAIVMLLEDTSCDKCDSLTLNLIDDSYSLTVEVNVI